MGAADDHQQCADPLNCKMRPTAKSVQICTFSWCGSRLEISREERMKLIQKKNRTVKEKLQPFPTPEHHHVIRSMVSLRVRRSIHTHIAAHFRE
jgi:hypothetical protein